MQPEEMWIVLFSKVFLYECFLFLEMVKVMIHRGVIAVHLYIGRNQDSNSRSWQRKST